MGYRGSIPYKQPWILESLHCLSIKVSSDTFIQFTASLQGEFFIPFSALWVCSSMLPSVIGVSSIFKISRFFQKKHNTLDLAEQTKAAIRIGAEIKSQILIDEVKLGILNKTYKMDHPEIEKLNMEILELQDQLSDLDHSPKNNSISNNNLFPQFSEVPNLEIELLRLKREVEIQSKLYAFLTQQYEESKIQEARDTPTIQVLDDANYPIKRYKPMRTLMVIGYSLIAFVLSAIYVIFVEFNKNGKPQ